MHCKKFNNTSFYIQGEIYFSSHHIQILPQNDYWIYSIGFLKEPFEHFTGLIFENFQIHKEYLFPNICKFSNKTGDLKYSYPVVSKLQINGK